MLGGNKDLERMFSYRKYAYILILIIIAFQVLSQTANLPVATTLGEAYVERSIREAALAKTHDENSFLPTAQREKMAERIVSDALKTDEVKELKEREIQRIREYYQSPQGVTYLFNYDTYRFLREANNLLKKGTTGEYERDGIPYDNLRLAPSEKSVDFRLVPYFILGTTYLLDFSPESVEKGAFWMPVLFGIISVLLMYFLGSFLFNKDIGFLSGLAMAMHPISFIIFKGGSADTPTINIFWSILIVFFFLKSFNEFKPSKNPKEWIKPIIYAGLALLCQYLFKLTWRGHFYIIILIVFYLIIYFAHDFYNKKNWTHMSILGALVAIMAFWFKDSYYMEKLMFRLGFIQPETFYPRVGETISELYGMSIPVFFTFYGWFFILLAAIGAFFLFKQQIKSRNEKSFLLIWALMFIVPFFAIRFHIYAVPPLSLLFGLGVYETGTRLSKFKFSLDQNLRKIGCIAILVMIFVFLTLPSITQAAKTYPYVDDAVNEISKDIFVLSEKNTIITTWWDYGYIYEHYTKRPLTFDGGSIIPRRLYWVSNALLTQDEEFSTGIIRMLNCGREDEALGNISQRIGKIQAVEALRELVTMDKEETSSYLKKNNLPEEILEMTHCDAPPGIIILSSDMLNKIKTINYFTDWNFEHKVSLSGEPNFARGDCAGNICSGGISFDPETKEIRMQGELPKKSIYISRNFSDNVTLINPDGMDLTIIIAGNEVFAMDPGFENSILVNGLLLNNLEKFELFSLKDMRKRIVAYKVLY